MLYTEIIFDQSNLKCVWIKWQISSKLRIVSRVLLLEKKNFLWCFTIYNLSKKLIKSSNFYHFTKKCNVYHFTKKCNVLIPGVKNLSQYDQSINFLIFPKRAMCLKLNTCGACINHIYTPKLLTQNLSQQTRKYFNLRHLPSFAVYNGKPMDFWPLQLHGRRQNW